MNKENQTAPRYQISKAAIEKHPVLTQFSALILPDEDATRIDKIRREEPELLENITEDKVLKLATKFEIQYRELEELAEDDDYLYESIEEGIGCRQAYIITELCYIIGWCENR